jgi:glycine dehydrogenase subunit 2
MFEPTETESKETLDRAAWAIKELYELALRSPEDFHNMPLSTPITRPDEVKAARTPELIAEE